MKDNLLESLEVAEIIRGNKTNYASSCDNVCDDFCNDCSMDTAMELKPYKKAEKHYQE